jgi:integrase
MSGRILNLIRNKRIQRDEQPRRTFTDEEVESMFAVVNCKKGTLILTILYEIGLRASAIEHLKYYMLLTTDHTPRHVCSVPEKGGKRREFVTSRALKAAIKAYADELRADDPGDIDRACYLLSSRNPGLPCTEGSVYSMVNTWAKKAGVVDFVVHPHAFRHTIVGKLMDAGNTLELVSKFMGHSNVNVTANSYWVPTMMELHNKMNNPFTGTYQAKVQSDTDAVSELEVTKYKLTQSLEIIKRFDTIINRHGATAIQLDIMKEIPNMAQLMLLLDDSSSGSSLTGSTMTCTGSLV